MHDIQDPTFTEDTADALLDELEVRCHTNVAAVRERPTKLPRVTADVFAGNACDRDGRLAAVSVGELDRRGLTGLSPRPLMVGSVFQLRFTPQTDVAATLAVCDRCTMLGDSSFELRFRLATPIDLPTT